MAGGTDINQIINETSNKYGIKDEEERKTLQNELEVKKRLSILDERISGYSDKDEKIRKLIFKATSSFSNNPRDMKRFMNVFRFQYFLLLARQNRGLNVPLDDQLRRWIILSMKWPELARWIQGRHNSMEYLQGSSSADIPPIHPRLKKLEDIVSGYMINDNANEDDIENSYEKWLKEMASLLGLDTKRNSWIADTSLRNFLEEEVKFKPEDRLSASVGNGFY